MFKELSDDFWATSDTEWSVTIIARAVGIAVGFFQEVYSNIYLAFPVLWRQHHPCKICITEDRVADGLSTRIVLSPMQLALQIDLSPYFLPPD